MTTHPRKHSRQLPSRRPYQILFASWCILLLLVLFQERQTWSLPLSVSFSSSSWWWQWLKSLLPLLGCNDLHHGTWNFLNYLQVRRASIVVARDDGEYCISSLVCNDGNMSETVDDTVHTESFAVRAFKMSEMKGMGVYALTTNNIHHRHHRHHRYYQTVAFQRSTERSTHNIRTLWLAASRDSDNGNRKNDKQKKESSNNVNKENKKQKEARGYRFGDVTKGLIRGFQNQVKDWTGKDEYEFGDATKYLWNNQLQGKIQSFTNRENYEFGDITKSIIKRFQDSSYTEQDVQIMVKLVALVGLQPMALRLFPLKVLIEMLQLSLMQDVSDKAIQSIATALDERFKEALIGDKNYKLGDLTKKTLTGSKDYQFGDLTKQTIVKFTGKERYEFGDITKALLNRRDQIKKQQQQQQQNGQQATNSKSSINIRDELTGNNDGSTKAVLVEEEEEGNNQSKNESVEDEGGMTSNFKDVVSPELSFLLELRRQAQEDEKMKGTWDDDYLDYSKLEEKLNNNNDNNNNNNDSNEKEQTQQQQRQQQQQKPQEDNRSSIATETSKNDNLENMIQSRDQLEAFNFKEWDKKLLEATETQSRTTFLSSDDKNNNNKDDDDEEKS